VGGWASYPRPKQPGLQPGAPGRSSFHPQREPALGRRRRPSAHAHRARRGRAADRAGDPHGDHSAHATSSQREPAADHPGDHTAPQYCGQALSPPYPQR
jgi:hypothetical protein